MKTIEEKAKNFVDHCQAVVTSEGNLYSEAAVYSAYLAGAAEALAGQWRSGDEPPEHNHIVFVLSDADESELRHTTAYHQDGIWHFPDDWYYGCKVLKWMEPPKTDRHADKT